MKRCVQHQPLYHDALGYVLNGCISLEKAARGISDLPTELVCRVFKHIFLFDGSVLVVLDPSVVSMVLSIFAARFYFQSTVPLPMTRQITGSWLTNS
jgi:hypothetical protein